MHSPLRTCTLLLLVVAPSTTLAADEADDTPLCDSWCGEWTCTNKRCLGCDPAAVGCESATDAEADDDDSCPSWCNKYTCGESACAACRHVGCKSPPPPYKPPPTPVAPPPAWTAPEEHKGKGHGKGKGKGAAENQHCLSWCNKVSLAAVFIFRTRPHSQFLLSLLAVHMLQRLVHRVRGMHSKGADCGRADRARERADATTSSTSSESASREQLPVMVQLVHLRQAGMQRV